MFDARIDAAMRNLVSVMVAGVAGADVDISCERAHSTEAVTVRVMPKDAELGKVIGKNGRTARAIRTVLQAACRQYGVTYQLDILGANELKVSKIA